MSLLHFLSFYFSVLVGSKGEVHSDDTCNTGQSTIDKRKRKKRNVKKPCDSQEILQLNVDQSVTQFYDKYLGNKFLKTAKASESK
jgi:hypothetical protein